MPVCVRTSVWHRPETTGKTLLCLDLQSSAKELWAGMIKPVASVPSGAAQEQLLGQESLFSVCTLMCPDGVSSLREIMVRKNHFHALRTGLCWVTGEETASGCAE